MSYYPRLLVPPASGIDTYVFQINRFGEIIAYRINPDRTISDFVSGSTPDVLELVFNKPASSVWVINNRNSYGREQRAKFLPEPWNLCGYEFRRWSEVQAAYNGKASRNRTIVRERISLIRSFDLPVSAYFDMGDDGLVLGEAAKTWDADRDEADAAKQNEQVEAGKADEAKS